MVAVVQVPGHRPVPVGRDGHQGEDGREGHAIIKEDPDAAHELSEGPVAEQDVKGVEGHGHDGHQ